MKHKLFVMLQFCVVFFAVIPLVTSEVYSQEGLRFVDKVQIGETKTRYYLHFDRNGNSPADRDIDRLKGVIKAGDEIDVRFYPNSIFAIDTVKSTFKLPSAKENCFFLYPYAKPDTFSIQAGYGELYFATNQEGKFLLRISQKPSYLKTGDSLKANDNEYKRLLEEATKEHPKPDTILTTQIRQLGASVDWSVWKYENLSLQKGSYSIELYLYSKFRAILLGKIDYIQVGDIYQNVKLTSRNDVSLISESSMDKSSRNGYFEGVIKSVQTVAGILSTNIVYDYLPGSWYYKQAPSASKNRKLFYNDETIAIEKTRELPSNIRIRAGFSVLDNLSEVRLISNLVLVLWPKNYFSDSTPFFQRINPTVGLQVGATGNQDIVLLLGMSIKLINEADLVTGFRFNGDHNKWQIGKNFYFGITLDPGLFGQLKNAQ